MRGGLPTHLRCHSDPSQRRDVLIAEGAGEPLHPDVLAVGAVFDAVRNHHHQMVGVSAPTAVLCNSESRPPSKLPCPWAW